MDLKTFSEEDFDPKKWINKAWSGSGNQGKEVFVANTVSRLQLYMKQLSNSLDETTTQLITSIPRVVGEASSLQTAAGALQQRLQSLEQKVLAVEQETGHSIDSLQRIDHLKGKLETAASSLREADKWTAVVNSLEDILESGVPTEKDKLAEVTEKVASLTASLELLSDSQDFDKKRLQMETLYNRLEAAVSIHLVDAMSQMNAEKTSRYVPLFEAMCRKSSVVRRHRSTVVTAAGARWSAAEHQHLAAATQHVTQTVTRQIDWLTDVLRVESPSTEIVNLYTELLKALNPSPTKILTANIKLCSTPQNGLDFILDVRTELDAFTNSIVTLLEGRQRNGTENVQPSLLKELGRVIYAPLRELLPKYMDIQTQAFMEYISQKDLEQQDLLEKSRAFQNLVERSEARLKNSLVNAKNIAGKAAYGYYVPAVEAFASSLHNQIAAHSRRIESEFLSSKQNAGVLSRCFPSALVLEIAAANFLEAIGVIVREIGEDLASETPSTHILLSIEDHLTDVTSKLSSPSFDDIDSIGSVPALKRDVMTLKSLSTSILREPVTRQLEKIPSLPVWCNNDPMASDLPDYALSPQEYITEIGQYLMTLPQHLEMHLTEKQSPLLFLNEVCNHTCELYAEKILNVRNMDHLGTRKCLTDLVYLSSVVEDLGSVITPSLKNLEKSLRSAVQVSQG